MRSGTLQHAVEIEGRGLFSGQPCRVEVRPAAAGSGIVFIKDGKQVACHPANFVENPNCTMMESGGARITQTEHMLCALWAAGIDTAEIAVDGPEMPNHDGSAKPLYDALLSGGLVEHGPRPSVVIPRQLRVDSPSGAWITIEPDEQLSVSYHFEHPELGTQDFDATITRAWATEQLLPARTFITEREALDVRAAGLLQHTDESVALLIRDPLSPPALRFPDEYARHKVLDLLGDLYAVPGELTGRINCHMSGHALNRELARKLASVAL
jgi:UDP-3-O-acyl-N-acetylglucosamine deacetylase